MQTPPANALAWFEIPVRDIDRAQTFYEALLGAPLRREPLGPTKTLAVLPYDGAGTGAGGCLLMADDAPAPSATGTLVYLNATPTLDATLARAWDAGAQVCMPKLTLPDGMGCIAHITDCEGNRVGLHAMT